MILNQQKYMNLLESKIQQIQYIVSTKNKDVLEKISSGINFEVFMKAPTNEQEEIEYKQKYEELEKHMEQNGYDHNVPLSFEELKLILIITEEELKTCFDQE